MAVLAEPPPEKALEVGAGHILHTQAEVQPRPSPVDSSDTSCLRGMRKRWPSPLIAPAHVSRPAEYAVETSCTQQVPAIQPMCTHHTAKAQGLLQGPSCCTRASHTLTGRAPESLGLEGRVGPAHRVGTEPEQPHRPPRSAPQPREPDFEFLTPRTEREQIGVV